jgi:hypothetical protein
VDGRTAEGQAEDAEGAGMSLDLLLIEQDPYGTKIPQEARIEAVLISLSQCRCRGHAGEVLQLSSTKNLLRRLYEFDRLAWQRMRAGIDGALRQLPKYEIASPVWAEADARPALPVTPPVQWDL